MIAVAASLVGTIVFVEGTRRLAVHRGRAPRGWMIAALLLGPIPLVLMLVMKNLADAAR